MTEFQKKSQFSTIFLGADHRGFEHKEHIKEWLESHGFPVVDCGAESYQKHDDFPDIAYQVARNVASVEQSCGILFCGSGVGVSVVANKIAGVRSALGFRADQVKGARHDDGVNVLSVPSDFLSVGEVEQLARAFLTTAFSNEESDLRRAQKIFDIEQAHAR